MQVKVVIKGRPPHKYYAPATWRGAITIRMQSAATVRADLEETSSLHQMAVLGPGATVLLRDDKFS